VIVLGLTGSIAMGKTTAANMFRRLGVPVWDADAVVHGLLARGGQAVAPIAAAFPQVLRDGAIDRFVLGARVFADAAALKRLETIIHPLVHADRQRFLGRAGRARIRLVVLDVPLLFETGGEAACDAVAVVSAPAILQRQRLRQRAGLTGVRIDAILARQMTDQEKRRRADFIIPTGLGRAYSMRVIGAMVVALRGPPATVAPMRAAGMRRRRRKGRRIRHARDCPRY
jgi:dephospho-CoA kinase